MLLDQMEFHISHQSRDRYQVDELLFSISGNVIFADFHNARVFAQKMNQNRDLVNFPEEAVKAGQIYAMGLIDEILHLIVSLYRIQAHPQAMNQALEWLYEHIGQREVDETLRQFMVEFPPLSVYRREISIEDYLGGETQRLISENESVHVSNREIILEEMLMLWLENKNPAFMPFQELFDDTELEKRTVYKAIIDHLHRFFEAQPTFGPDSQKLIDMLRSPAIASPHSLSGQLEYIRTHWAFLLGRYLYRLLGSLDLIKEEEKATFTGPGPTIPYDFTGMELEQDQFTPDREWMPSLVLIAKNTYIWLDQLSKIYHREINQLDQIPDEELSRLAKWGINGLWFIGIWERSPASKRIKQIRGKLDAEASAYSVFDYQIAADLGGEAAYQELRDRAWQRGIRLASDMVPNHMGIDSKWVVEHPHRFISLDYSPFPSYTFNGPNLSWDERVGVYLEDHYYDSTDAAVVFKRVDHHTGDSRFIYHGNDGTSMPWNDTAQWNFLLPEVRDQIIQVILNVAQKFPIIRFDAAMTLAKKHYQRLWYPQPGTGGSIPTRADQGLTKEEFDAAMPKEFWREVVDTISNKAPDTLLLAEAFWLMEGYFVRTLGMHRVYNSAFMNMLRDEKNQEYRLVIKNTLEFDPEILKRYVNFMSNPDEETAVTQFGKNDKYFGICALMATMPGLPMFGHGQIEGFSEKYGMEFRRAYWEETPDSFLIERHEREIFPLLRRRHLFAEVKDFLLYDFYAPDGTVNEDVFAYSNRFEVEQTLVVYHNRFACAQGWIRTSASFAAKSDQKGDRVMVQKTLGEGLGLINDQNIYCIFRDQITGLEYLVSNADIHQRGLFIELEAYEYHVFLDFQQVEDDESHQYSQLNEVLNGRGVPSVVEALKELFLRSVHNSFGNLINSRMISRLMTACIENLNEPIDSVIFDELERNYTDLLHQIQNIVQKKKNDTELEVITRNMCQLVEATCKLPHLDSHFPYHGSRDYIQAVEILKKHMDKNPQTWVSLLTWIYIQPLGRLVDESQALERSRSWVDEFLLGRIITRSVQDLGIQESTSGEVVSIVKFLTTQADWPYKLGLLERPEFKSRITSIHRILQEWLRDGEIQRFLQINRYQGVLWFNRESFEGLLALMLLAGSLRVLSETDLDDEKIPDLIVDQYGIIERLRAASEGSNYQVDRLLEALE